MVTVPKTVARRTADLLAHNRDLALVGTSG